MSNSYKELRQRYRKTVDDKECRCILSGLLILNKNELSLEHLVPLCRWHGYEAKMPYNIFPAYKIINSMKSGMLFCEWLDNNEYILTKALRKNHLKKGDREIVEAALENIPYYNIDPCMYCFLAGKCGKER